MDNEAVAVGSTASGHVRKQSKLQIKKLHIGMPGPSSLSDGCAELPVAGRRDVCVPTGVHNTRVYATVEGGASIQGPNSGAVEPSSEVAGAAEQLPDEISVSSPGLERHAVTTSLGPQPSEPGVSQSSPSVPLEGRLKALGFSESVIKRIETSRASSTRKHYRSQWDLFLTWTTEKKLNPLDASLPLLTRFMDYLFRERGVSVRTILNYKSEIAFYWKSQVGYVIPEEDSVVADLVRSSKRERSIPRKHVEWDIRLELEFFNSGRFQHLDQLSDRDLTLKTIFLLALATGKRRSEIHALSQEVRWINGDVRTVEISLVPSFMSKTHVITNGLGALRPIILSSLEGGGAENGDHLLCPVCTLDFYMKRSAKYRSPEQKRLIISYRRGFTRDISRQTISAYIKEAVVLAYLDASVQDVSSPVHVKPHSLRHVATSLSALQNFSLEDVLKAGAWASPNVFMKHYAQSFSTDTMSKLSRLGGFVAAGTVI